MQPSQPVLINLCPSFNNQSNSGSLETKVTVTKVKVKESLDKDKKTTIKPMEGSGRWTDEEHKRFLEAEKLYGKDWKLIENYIGTRTAAQTRSHAQKYYRTLNRHKIKNENKSQDSTSLSSPESNKKSMKECNIKSKKSKRVLNYEEKSTMEPLKKIKETTKEVCCSISTDIYIKEVLEELSKDDISIYSEETIPKYTPSLMSLKYDANTCLFYNRELDIEDFINRMDCFTNYEGLNIPLISSDTIDEQNEYRQVQF